MTEWTRVKDKETGHEYSVAVVNPEAHEVVEKPAADRYGTPFPPKPNRPLSALTGPGGKPVTDMTLPELQDYAARNSIELGEASRKQEVLDAIAAAPSGVGATPPAV